MPVKSALTFFVCALGVLARPAANRNATANLPVEVEIFENVAASSPFQVEGLQPTERYREPAFGFIRTPIKYSRNAIPLDRSTPFVLRATYSRRLAPGAYSF